MYMSGTLRFPSPFEVETPAGCEGWEEMYPAYMRFSEARRELEESRLCFYNGMHFPEPISPFDVITAEAFYIAIGEMNARFFCIPPAMGVDFRVLNGYVYISGIPVLDPQKIQERVELFQRRAGHYYENWSTIYEDWKQRVINEIEALKAIRFPHLPEIEPEELVFAHRGIGTSMTVFESYNRVIESLFRIAQIHCEIVMIGFAAYLTFYDFCKRFFPEIPDQQITLMVSGIDVSMMGPDKELRALAQRAVELGLAEKFSEGRSWREVFTDLEQHENGRAWLQEWNERGEPWFWINAGNGLKHQLRAWRDDPSPIFPILIEYVKRAARGESIQRDTSQVREKRDRITAEYRALLPSEADRQAFDQLLALVRQVYDAPSCVGHPAPITRSVPAITGPSRVPVNPHTSSPVRRSGVAFLPFRERCPSPSSGSRHTHPQHLSGSRPPPHPLPPTLRARLRPGCSDQEHGYMRPTVPPYGVNASSARRLNRFECRDNHAVVARCLVAEHLAT